MKMRNAKRRTRTQTADLIIQTLLDYPNGMTTHQIARELNRKQGHGLRPVLQTLVTDGYLIVWWDTGTNGQQALFYALSPTYAEKLRATIAEGRQFSIRLSEG